MKNELPNYKDEILRMHADGFDNRQIQKKLGCSRSTVSYHLNPNQKIQVQIRSQRYSREKQEAKKNGLVREKMAKVKIEKPKKEPKKTKAKKPDTGAKPANKRDKIFPTLVVDLNARVKIVIDTRTTIYAKPGCNVKEIRAKYEAKKQMKL